jgi:hypothetical protein
MLVYTPMVVERGKDVVIEGLACSSTHIPPLSIHPVHKKKNTHTTHTHIYYEYFSFFYYVCVHPLASCWPPAKPPPPPRRRLRRNPLGFFISYFTSTTPFKDFLKSHTYLYCCWTKRENHVQSLESLYSAALLILLCVLYYIRVLLCWKILAQSSRASSGT